MQSVTITTHTHRNKTLRFVRPRGDGGEKVRNKISIALFLSRLLLLLRRWRSCCACEKRDAMSRGREKPLTQQTLSVVVVRVCGPGCNKTVNWLHTRTHAYNVNVARSCAIRHTQEDIQTIAAGIYGIIKCVLIGRQKNARVQNSTYYDRQA